jgi:hypothetical protein
MFVEAGQVNLLGQIVNAAIPTGFCEVGNHPADAEMVGRTREVIGNSNQILALFADCKELDDLRKGKRLMLDNYGQILAQTPKGQLRAIKGVSRSEYIQKISAKSGNMPDALKQAENRVKQYVPKYQSHESLGLLGTDTNGLYVGLLMSMTDDTGRARSILGVVGMTLVKEFSITINLYQVYKNSPDLRGLLSRQQGAIASLVNANN